MLTSSHLCCELGLDALLRWVNIASCSLCFLAYVIINRKEDFEVLK